MKCQWDVEDVKSGRFVIRCIEYDIATDIPYICSSVFQIVNKPGMNTEKRWFLSAITDGLLISQSTHKELTQELSSNYIPIKFKTLMKCFTEMRERHIDGF